MLWILFVLEIVAGLVTLLVPGAPLLYALGVRRLPLVILSPCASIILYVLWGVLLHTLGLSCSGLVLLILACGTSFALLAVRLLLLGRPIGWGLNSGYTAELFGEYDGVESYKTFALYIGVALVLCTAFFVIPICGPESFSSSSDNAFHLSLIRSFLDSGTYCILHTSVFPLASASSFYPIAWHILAAIVASLFGGAVTAAANAINLLVLGILFPSACYFLLGFLLGPNSTYHRMGSVVSLSFAAFPWGFLNWGQLAPLLLAFSLVPVFVCVFGRSLRLESVSIRKGLALSLIPFASLTLAHPSAAFMAGIFCLPAIFTALRTRLPRPRNLPSRLFSFLVLVGLTAFVLLVWLLMYRLPLLSSVVGYQWGGDTNVVDALISSLSYCFGGLQSPQYLLGVVSIIGFVVALKSPVLRALCPVSVILLVMCLIDRTTSSTLQHLLTGFWYTDPYRIGAMFVLSCVPLACIGFVTIARRLSRPLRRGSGLCFPRCAGPCVVTLMLFSTFSPNVLLPGGKEVVTGFGRMSDHLEYSYDLDSEYAIDASEREFLNEVAQITQGARIINCPYDGSVYAYGALGLNVQYRIFTDRAGRGDDIPAKLCDLAADPSVRKRVEELGARYVLLLDADWPKSGTVDQNADIPSWSGIADVSEETPGFKLILSRGDMRLFAIL